MVWLVVHDKIRDKMYVDIRQTFSIWFIPMYHAHVRLVTVLDLVASDDADFHDPLDRIIKQEREGGEKSTAQLLYHASIVSEHQYHNHQQHRRHHQTSDGHASRRYKIHRQEDLYQVNDFLKFAGGPGPLPFLWFLFQLQATALCVLMSLFLRLSPWAFQPEPAKGGVEAIIERVESYHDLASERAEEESHHHQDDNKLVYQAEEEKPAASAVENHNQIGNGGEIQNVLDSTSSVGATNGHNGQHQAAHAQHNEQREQGPKHEQDTGANNGGTRRESANSKASPSQPRKHGKSGKKGGSGR